MTLFLTSCNRPHLLKRTLESFMKYNTYPLSQAIILEDSGLKGINDFAHSILNCPLTIIYNETRMGQMKSIENGLQYLCTPYVFHCEEDWEFYDYGFIEKSMEILKQNKYVTSVWLRSYHELQTMYKFPIISVDTWIRVCNKSDILSSDTYRIIGPHIGNFSWNPGLKTLEVAKKFAPYTSSTLPTSICEGGMRDAFRDLGMVSAVTCTAEGYVKHIGWNDHVW